VANLADSIEKIVREELSPGIQDALVELDPLFADIKQNTRSASQSEIGRDWKAIMTFITSLAGSLRAEADTAIEGDDLSYGTGAGEPAVIYSPSVTWPSIAESPAPGYVQRTIQLKRWKGNMFVPHDILRADRLTASIGSQVAATIKQTARMVAHHKANLFMASNATTRPLGVISAVITNGTTSQADAVVSLKTSTPLRRLQPGMVVDVHDASNSWVQLNDQTAAENVVIVKAVDPVTGYVTLTHTISTGRWAANLAEDDVIVLRKSFDASGGLGYGPKGPMYWMVNSGSVYGLNTAYYPQFKSLIQAVSGTLTNEVLRKYIGTYMNARSVGWWPDTLLTTSGVLSDYVGETDDIQRFQVQGAPVNVRGGFAAGTTFTYDGRTFPIRTSALMPGGELWGLRLKGNITRYTPPKLPGAGSSGEFDGDIEFVAPLGGLKGIWKHTTVNDALSPYVEAPFECIEEYAPEIIPGIRLTGLTEWTA